VQSAQSETKKRSLYVLGAGFSRSAGLPLASELWQEILRRALPMQGRASKFRDDLEDYIEFRERCDGKRPSLETVNFEEFLGFLDVEHFLGLRGKETWSEAGNEGQIVVKTLIGQILTERTPSTSKIPNLYLQFAHALQPGDRIITFNYDILLERALDIARIPYRLFPNRYDKISSMGGYRSMKTFDKDDSEVEILKMHGSVDWFDKKPFLEAMQSAREQGFESYIPPDPIFNSERGLKTARVVDGPRLADDPMREMYRLINVSRFYGNPAWFLSVPSLVSPSVSKVIYSRPFLEFWRGLRYEGAYSRRLVVIGYSLPPHDDYARQVLYRLIDNYQNVPESKIFPENERRNPLLMIDLHTNKKQLEAFKRRYSFVDWSKTNLFSQGFDSNVVDQLTT